MSKHSEFWSNFSFFLWLGYSTVKRLPQKLCVIEELESIWTVAASFLWLHHSGSEDWPCSISTWSEVSWLFNEMQNKSKSHCQSNNQIHKSIIAIVGVKQRPRKYQINISGNISSIANFLHLVFEKWSTSNVEHNVRSVAALLLL